MGYLPDPDLLRGGGTLTKGGRLRDKTPPPPKAGWDRDLGAQRLILIGLVWRSVEGWGGCCFFCFFYRVKVQQKPQCALSKWVHCWSQQIWSRYTRCLLNLKTQIIVCRCIISTCSMQYVHLICPLTDPWVLVTMAAPLLALCWDGWLRGHGWQVKEILIDTWPLWWLWQKDLNKPP